MDFRVFSRNISENMHARCVREDTKQALKGNLHADGVQIRQTLFVRYCLKAALWVLPKEKEETFMKLVTYLQNGIEQIGVLTPAEDAVVPAGMLGLDITKKIIHLHHAQISVRSEEHAYTEFEVRLPHVEPPEQEHE